MKNEFRGFRCDIDSKNRPKILSIILIYLFNQLN